MISNRIRIEGTVDRLKEFLNGLYVDVSDWDDDYKVRPSFSAYVPFPCLKKGDVEWAYRNWGTVSDLNGDDQYDIDQLLKGLNRKRRVDKLTIIELIKETKNGSLIPFLLKVSLHFPDLLFEITSSDEGDWILDTVFVQQGNLTRKDIVDNRVEAWKFRLSIFPDSTKEEMLEFFWDDLINEIADEPTKEEMLAYAPIYFKDLYTEEDIPWNSNDNRITKSMLGYYYESRN